MRVFVGTDHAGLELKEHLKRFLVSQGFEVEDEGAHRYDENDDYPDFIVPVARQVAAHPGSRGIVLGGSGQGEAIAANKVRGIRAALYYGGTLEIVRLSRLHNDANVLSLGARFIGRDEAIEAVRVWLSTEFSHEPRHARRIGKIDVSAG